MHSMAEMSDDEIIAYMVAYFKTLEGHRYIARRVRAAGKEAARLDRKLESMLPFSARG